MPGVFEHVDKESPTYDRRTHSRKPVRTLAYVELDEGNGGIILNVSEGGLSVQAVMSLMEDSLPKMRFQLSQSNDWLETSARVVWASESRKVAGLKFVDLPDEARLQIRNWLVAEAAEVEPAEPYESAVSDHTQDQVHHHGHNERREDERRDRGIDKELAGIGRTGDRAAGPVPPAPVSVSLGAQLFGQAPAVQANEEFAPDAKRRDRAWNIAGLVALLAIASLIAGWIAGRGSFDGIWDRTRATTSPGDTSQPPLAPVLAAASSPISGIEVVDIHNKRWTIPFGAAPTPNLNSSSSHGQAQAVQWPAINPAATVPKTQAPAAVDNAHLQQPNPPEVKSPNNAAGVVLPSDSSDFHDLAPPAPKPQQPTGVLQRGALIYHVNPEYPELAREQRVEGTVKLQATIGVNGAVRTVVAVSGPGLLIEAARNAVRQWRYTPSLLDGKPVESQEYVSVVFQLPPASK